MEEQDQVTNVVIYSTGAIIAIVASVATVLFVLGILALILWQSGAVK
jgi:hypothetical protein